MVIANVVKSMVDIWTESLPVKSPVNITTPGK